MLGPAFAIDKRPGVVCFLAKFSSANFSPYIDFPPVPYMEMLAVFIRLSDARRAGTHVATSEVTALKHELRDHAMELGSAVTKALLTSAKGTEILSGLGNNIIEEFEVDTASLVYDEISHGSNAVSVVALKDSVQWQKAGKQQCYLTFFILGWA